MSIRYVIVHAPDHRETCMTFSECQKALWSVDKRLIKVLSYDEETCEVRDATAEFFPGILAQFEKLAGDIKSHVTLDTYVCSFSEAFVKYGKFNDLAGIVDRQDRARRYKLAA